MQTTGPSPPLTGSTLDCFADRLAADIEQSFALQFAARNRDPRNKQNRFSVRVAPPSVLANDDELVYRFKASLETDAYPTRVIVVEIPGAFDRPFVLHLVVQHSTPFRLETDFLTAGNVNLRCISVGAWKKSDSDDPKENTRDPIIACYPGPGTEKSAERAVFFVYRSRFAFLVFSHLNADIETLAKNAAQKIIISRLGGIATEMDLEKALQWIERYEPRVPFISEAYNTEGGDRRGVDSFARLWTGEGPKRSARFVVQMKSDPDDVRRFNKQKRHIPVIGHTKYLTSISREKLSGAENAPLRHAIRDGAIGRLAEELIIAVRAKQDGRTHACPEYAEIAWL